MERFGPGDSVVWRSVDRENRIVQTVWPWTVVRDNENGTVLYIPAGTVGKRRTGERGGPGDRFIVRWDGGHADITWERTNVIRVYGEGDAHSVWFAFDATTWVPVWRYINIEDPWLRTPIGFDSRDLYLDLYADPDGEEWHWKDEDELDWVVEQGRIGATRVAAIRAEGERAVARVRGDPGFGLEWRGWRPERRWSVPTLPARWRDFEP
ncbi:MAG: DUF402 domain-containing protein [Candidatus Limnocylindria bacterium]